MPAPTPADLEQMWRCATRELAMRRQCYPRWILSRKMSPATAAAEIAAMQKIVNLIESMQADALLNLGD